MKVDHSPVGCVALKQTDGEACEMRRMFVIRSITVVASDEHWEKQSFNRHVRQGTQSCGWTPASDSQRRRRCTGVCASGTYHRIPIYLRTSVTDSFSWNLNSELDRSERLREAPRDWRPRVPSLKTIEVPSVHFSPWLRTHFPEMDRRSCGTRFFHSRVRSKRRVACPRVPDGNSETQGREVNGAGMLASCRGSRAATSFVAGTARRADGYRSRVA